MQISTVYYFGFFLVAMPLLGLFEKPRRLPNSITEAVLAKRARGEAVTDMKPAGGYHTPSEVPAAPNKD